MKLERTSQVHTWDLAVASAFPQLNQTEIYSEIFLEYFQSASSIILFCRFQAIACIDACFQHVQCKNAGVADPLVTLPHSIFLSSTAVEAACNYVDNLHTKGPIQHRKEGPSLLNQEDQVEEGLKIPNSVLEECEKSFIAADENQNKAAAGSAGRYWAYGMGIPPWSPYIHGQHEYHWWEAILCYCPVGSLVQWASNLVENGDTLWHRLSTGS